jgi:hypothetical protein
MKKIKGNLPLLEHVKRCYVDTELRTKCPKCGEYIVFNFSENYLSYPKISKLTVAGTYCEKCDKWYKMPVKVTKAEVEIACYVEKMEEE